MAKRIPKTGLKEPPAVPSDNDLIIAEPPTTQTDSNEQDVFTDKAESDLSFEDLPKSVAPSIVENLRLFISAMHSRLSTVQKALAISIGLTAVVLVYGLLKSRQQSLPVQPVAPAVEQRVPAFGQIPELTDEPVEGSIPQEPVHALRPQSALTNKESISLKAAETFYITKDYPRAYTAYKQLSEILPSGQEESLRDFFYLRMALCVTKAGRQEHADRLLRTIALSRFPVISVFSTYRQAISEMQKRQYFNATMKAYQTIALAEAVEHHKDWAEALQHECRFLVAESMTRNALSLLDADKDLPPQLWSQSPDLDPFANLSEAQLRTILNSGTDKLSKALLGPKIDRLDQLGRTRWSIICNGASIDELLARFASNTGLDIHWSSDPTPSSREILKTLRKRPVTLCFMAATPQQLVTTAAGSVGLLARMDTDKTVTILNPLEHSLLSEYTSILTKEAILLWQRLLLTSYRDRRIPNIHFALALLQALQGNLTEAIAEYKLVANRFPQTPLAQYALFQSSKLKVELKDYVGAREDLKQLVEQYPGNDLADKACLYLADATMRAELWDEAARLYRKVYNLGLSTTSQAISALGAGKCCYQKKDYNAANEWLTRYLGIAADSQSLDVYSAYVLLGKTKLALGAPDEACEAFQQALKGPLPRQQYIQTISSLVEARIEQGRFVEALNMLENTHTWPFSQNESVEILLLRARGLRSMGLLDKAVSVLSDMAQYLPDPQLKAKLSFELVKCYIGNGDLELARKTLSDILVYVEPGHLANDVRYELAKVCLRLGQTSQSISICRQLLISNLEQHTRRNVLDLMTQAYAQQKDYDKAVLTLLGSPDADNYTITRENFNNLTVITPTQVDDEAK
jgi:tetratricopeptide (TPR) repeat protein